MTGRTCLHPAGRPAPPRPRQVPSVSASAWRPGIDASRGGVSGSSPVPRPFMICRLGSPGATSPALVRGGSRLLQEPVWAALAGASTRFLRLPPASRSLPHQSLLWDLPHATTSPTSPGDSWASALQGVRSTAPPQPPLSRRAAFPGTLLLLVPPRLQHRLQACLPLP